MGKPRDTYKYHFKVGSKIKHGGLTRDLRRRERELKQTSPSGHITKVGRRTIISAARKWRKEHGYI